VNFLGRTWAIGILFGILVIATRYPHAPGQLFTFDDVNFAYSVGHFDVRISQPQPPGYPLFVLELRILYWLRFRRAESLLLALALAGSITALVLLARFGERLFGGLAGFFAACLLVIHPVFWHAGIVSALRVQLAVVSVVAASACWRAWTGDARWVLRSAVVLALCAGVRPEIGVVLFPLWAASALRAPVSWENRAKALAAMAATVLLWLLPAMIASGGPVTYVKACLAYIGDQASETSQLFGAVPDKWHTTLWRLITWTCCGLISWTLPAVLAWPWRMDLKKLQFLAIWFVPPFVFALFVHLQDPGQSLAMAPPIALFGGYLFQRALDHWHAYVSRWHTVTLILASLAAAWAIEFRDRAGVVAWIPAIALAAGLLLKIDQTKNAGYLPRAAAMLFLVAPVVIVNWNMFLFEGWYHEGNQALADIESSLALTSIGHIHHTLDVDDHSLRQVIRLAAERPGQTTVVWEHGLVTWLKVSYYSPAVPIVVLEHATLRSGSQPVIVKWKGPVMQQRTQGPVILPRGGRVVWLLNPRTEFYKLASECFPLTPAGPVWYTDLPSEPGAQTLGEYELKW